MARDSKLKFGFPLGALQDEVIELFEAARYRVKIDQELQRVEIGDPDVISLLSRPISIASLVEKGILDAGISTEASLIEAKVKNVKRVCDLEYQSLWGKTKVILAVPSESKIESVQDLQGKKIITRIPEITKGFLKRNNIKAEIIYSDTLINESKVGVIADAIVEFSRIGNVLSAYNLKVLKVLLETSVILITSKRVLQNSWKRKKVQELATRLKKVLSTAKGKTIKHYTPWPTNRLDDVDLTILKVLFEDGRKSFVEIAKQTKLSSVGVKKRIEKLMRDNILKVQGLFNIEKVHTVSAEIGIEADSNTIIELAERFLQSPLVYHLVRTSGKYNLIVGVVAPDLGSIENFVTREIREKPGVKQIEVNIGELPMIPKWAPPIF